MEQQFDFSPETSSMEQVQTPAPTVPQAPVVSAAIPEETPAPKPEKKPKNGLWLALAIMALSISILTGCFAVYAAKSGQMIYQIPQSVTPNYNFRENVEIGDKLTNQEIIQKVSPSVVTVMVEVSENGQTATGFGTGIIYTDNGYILTNAHVVAEARNVAVTDINGNRYNAKVVGQDAQSDTAVIKIEATGLTPAEFGQSSKVVPGDKVIAIGTPYDMNLSYTATEGMVSALRDSLQFPELGYTLDLIQHDAAINSGNSGGPLVNEYGQVIGINSIKISGTYENLGFALQIDDVIPLAQELMNNGKISRPGIGITGYTFEMDNLRGAFIYTVVENGPAHKAGLQPGDIIIKADDTVIETIDGLKDALQSKKIGDKVTVTYMRNNQIHTAELVLEELQG